MISAKIIADSISSNNKRITTVQLRYPRFIHAEFMTHRVFSRNASSSRAIPVKNLIQDIIDDPVYPSYWGANQKGMQAGEEIDAPILTEWVNPPEREWTDWDAYQIPITKKQAWDEARNEAIKWAERFDKAGYHKQIVNRLLEPFSHINVVVTATEWNNFFHLRCHPAAQPEMRMLAEAVYAARETSTPEFLNTGEWHLPYLTEDDKYKLHYDYEDWKLAINVSVARCARVSYLTHEGEVAPIEKELKLYNDLVGSVPLHASPAEHQATPDTMGHNFGEDWDNPDLHGNFKGWIQYRKTLPQENIEG